MSRPRLYIIAGPNGAGKTTFATKFLPAYAGRHISFINADLIAKGLSPFSPETIALSAGRLLLKRIQELSRAADDFAFETTLSGKSYAPFLRKLKRQGYLIHLFFLWVPSVELSLARIKERVSEGGHDIPAEDVRRRFPRSVRNFFQVYRPLSNSWTILDNSTEDPRLIARGEGGKRVVEDADLYARILKMAGITHEN